MEGYSFGKADLCAAGVGAPHIRQRLYWVAHSTEQRWIGRRSGEESHGGDSPWEQSQRLRDAGRLGIHHGPGRQQGQPPSPPMGHWGPAESTGSACGMAHSVIQGLEGHSGHGDNGDQSGRVGENEAGSVAEGGAVGGVADTTHVGRREERPHAGRGAGGDRAQGQPAGLGAGSGDLWTSPLHGFWRDADWLFCRDGKWRPVEPGSFPLVDGFSKGMGLGSDPCPPINPYSAEARVMRLKGYGNAICVQVAAEFLKAALNLP